MTKLALALVVGAVMLTAAGSGAASAQTRLRGQYFDPMRQAPPLVVRGRPFTDSGTSVPVGSEDEYVVDQTTLRRPVYSSFTPDFFGQDVLPRPFDGLGLY